MFSSLAWLRVFAFAFIFFSPSFTNAREDSIFTSSVTYCSPPETLLISRFEVEYFASNQSVSFNVSAASVQANISVVANLFLNVYGMKPVNVTLDLCNILGGALCPLPMYNFTGADSLTLPDSLGIAGKLPAIGFKIPDLEGFAQLTLTEVKTGAIKACVQATLANGWSTHQVAVEWTTGGVALAAFIASLGLSFLATDSIAPFRFIELISLYQSIATSSLLSLNYPSIYRAYALNFSWAIGLLSSTSIQNSINSMRHRTGGNLADDSSGSAVQFVNRKLSPYNLISATSNFAVSLGSIARREIAGLAERFTTYPSTLPFPGNDVSNLARRHTQTIDGDVQTVTSDSSNVLQAGLPIYVNSAHVATANAFMTVFLCILIVFAIGIAALAVGYGILVLSNWMKARKQNRPSESSVHYLAFARSWILRLSFISFAPFLIFTFYQWTLKDSWASILLSVLSLVAFIGLIGWPAFCTLRLARTRSAFDLYNPDESHFAAHAPLYAQYRVPRYFFFTVTLSATVIRAIFIAFAKSNATVQIALLVALEGFVLIAYAVLKPYPTRGGDVFGTYIAIVRFVCTGLMVGFLQPLNVSPIPRVVIGIIIALIFSVAIIVTIINFVLNLFIPGLFKKLGGGLNSSQASASDGSILEKGEKGTVMGTESQSVLARARPLNPTPQQSNSLDLDTSILQPFPISPTGTTVTTMDPPSIYSRDSGTMTVGSLMPRRWSFSWSQPNSPAESSTHGYSGRDRESAQFSSSPAQTSEGYLSRRTSDSMGLAPSSSPSAWRPPSSGGSSSSGHLTRPSSSKVLQTYQQNHEHIPEHPVS